MKAVLFVVPFLISACIAVSVAQCFFAEEDEKPALSVKITTGNHTMEASFINNATSRALIARFPLTLPMMNLYSREMCYRFSAPLPAEEAATSGYKIGDIAYWTPRHSFVIFYKQNNEMISNLQKVGHIDSGLEFFNGSGDSNVTFELL